MLANVVEGGYVKCHKYWPETGTQSFGPFNVTITGQQILADYTTREFSVQVYTHSKSERDHYDHLYLTTADWQH